MTLTFEVLCMALIAMYFGIAVAFFGYRLFKFVLPIVGFLFGFALGAQTIAILFNQGFLVTILAWVVGFFAGLLFAALSYWIFVFAVAMLSAAFGYLLGFVLMAGVFDVTSFWSWLIGLLLAFAVAFIVLYFKIYKFAIVFITAILGTGVALTALLLPFDVFKLSDFVGGAPLRSFISRTDSWLLILTWLVVAVLGIIVQLRKKPEMDYAEETVETPAAKPLETRAQEIAPPVAVEAPVAAVAAAAVVAAASEPEPEPAPESIEVPVETVVATETAAVVAADSAEPPYAAPAEGEAGAVDTKVAVPTGDLSEDQLRSLNQEIRYVEGIGPAYADKLNAANVFTVTDLLGTGATRKGRADLVAKTGISAALVLRWVNHADLIRVKGIGSQYADLLEEAGVDTVVELAHRNAQNLHTKMTEINTEKNLVRQLPSLSAVEGWIELAKALPRVVSY